MADCREQVYSDEFFDFIVSYEETNEQTIAGACIQIYCGVFKGKCIEIKFNYRKNDTLDEYLCKQEN